MSLSWLVIIPAGGWIIATTYIPLFSEHLSTIETWAVTGTVLLLMGVSLLGHVAAHLYATQAAKQPRAEHLAILLYGDASQLWSASGSGWKEFVVAAAGPLTNLILSGLFYLIWNAQLGVFLNLVALFLSVFNVWLFIINLLPAFPLDGGRLVRAGLAEAGLPPSVSTIWLRRLSFLTCLLLTGWAAFLYLQHSRFSPETAGITLALVLLVLDGLIFKPHLHAEPVGTEVHFHPLPFIATILLAVIMLGAFASTLLTNNGLDAPGVALSVEPMVHVPAQYSHPHAGTFILLTVFSHAPILAGEWLAAHVNPSMSILPPEQVVPKNTSIQEQARQGYQQLDESEATAITVGLRLAGYTVSYIGKGAQVAAILPESQANGILNSGDVITALNGQPVHTTDDLIRLVRAQSGKTPVQLEVLRGQSTKTLTVALLPPDASSPTPRIGISIQTAGFDFQPPFPVSIQTQKIQGGPSAGLMFTLTLYNALSPNDLTGGRKIAGTGTISLDGSVGPIGGVKQKVAAAEATGAAYFLCPVENYADAISVARSIKVVKVANVQDALSFLRSLPGQ